jgi:hypothetical protein
VATVAIYNGFGQYETRGKEKGVALSYSGVEFWLPYKRVAYIPDYTFRSVDHAATAAAEGEEGVLTYRDFRLSGDRIAEELLETQIPTPNKDKGIIKIDKKNQTGAFINVYAGVTAEGLELTTEVPEVEVSDFEVVLAERLALDYKRQVVQEYLQSKRERMAGGHGRMTPAGLTKVFMNELGVKDIDTIPAVGENSDLKQLLTEVLTGAKAQKAPEPAIADDLV